MPTHTQLSRQKQTRIKQLAQAGHSKYAIVKLTGCSYPTVDKYVDVDQARLQAIQPLKAHASPLLHELLALGMHLQHKLLTSLCGDDISSLSTVDKRQLMRDASIVVGTIYDKIRLQDGRSTSNQSYTLSIAAAHALPDRWALSSGSQLDKPSTSDLSNDIKEL